MSIEFVENDDKSKLEVSVTEPDGTTIVSLATASITTVTVKWITQAGALTTKAMTVTSATGGVAEYQFATGELEPPEMDFEIMLTDTSSKVMHSLDLISVEVRERLAS